MNQINIRLAEFRKYINLTQKEFSDELEVPLSTYKQYEKEGTTIPHHLLEKVSLRFNMSLNWLFSGLGFCNKNEKVIFELFFEIENKIKISTIDSILKRLYQLFLIDGYLEKDCDIYEKDLEKICEAINKKENHSIDIMEHYKKGVIPYTYLIYITVETGIPIEWILFGNYEGRTCSAQEILNIKKTGKFYHHNYDPSEAGLSEIISLLKYAPPVLLDKFKNTLLEMKHITEKI